MGSEIKVSTRSLFGYALVIIGLVMLGYVSLNAVYLSSGVFQPLKVQVNDAAGKPLLTSVETQVFFGVVVQIGMYALLVSIAFVLMSKGWEISRGQ